MARYSRAELMAVAAAHELRDGQVVVVGLGLPQVAAVLAKMTHAPRLTIVLEIGVVDPRPIHPSVGIADPRLWYGATCFTSGFIGTLASILHRGLVDVGFLGGLEVDQYGNVNTTAVPLPEGGIRHFTGSGGANDIASLARATLIVMRHEKRKFPARVSYLTSPGFLRGGREREAAGLRGGGPSRVITDLGTLGFDPVSRRMRVAALHPGVTWEEVQANTGFSLGEPEPVPRTPEPTEEELRLLRDVIDPVRAYIR